MIYVDKNEFEDTIQELDSKKANVKEILEHNYHLEITQTIEDNSQVVIPCNYKVGVDVLDVFFMGERLVKTTDEKERTL